MGALFSAFHPGLLGTAHHLESWARSGLLGSWSSLIPLMKALEEEMPQLWQEHRESLVSGVISGYKVGCDLQATQRLWWLPARGSHWIKSWGLSNVALGTHIPAVPKEQRGQVLPSCERLLATPRVQGVACFSPGSGFSGDVGEESLKRGTLYPRHKV